MRQRPYNMILSFYSLFVTNPKKHKLGCTPRGCQCLTAARFFYIVGGKICVFFYFFYCDNCAPMHKYTKHTRKRE